MDKASEARSGLPLLLIYTLLVIAAMAVAIATYLTLARVAPAFGDIVFIVLLLGAIVGTWPIADWIEHKVANRNADAGAAIPVAVKVGKPRT